MTIEITFRDNCVDDRVVRIWIIEWASEYQHEANVLRFLTRDEAEATRETILRFCSRHGMNPRALPFAAVIILLEATKRGRHGLKMIVAESRH
jgi:hypothetical protein